MATPPFLPDETKPADGDIVSQYPAVERTFRDIIEDWLLIDHDTAGEHAQVTLPERGSDPSNVTDTGFVYTKDDGGDTELFYEDDGGAVVQLTADGAINVPTGVLDAPANTSMLFYQSLAPTGWTKDTAATLGNHALRIVTDEAWSAGSKGATAFTSVFGAAKVSGGHVLTTAELPTTLVGQPTNSGTTDNNQVGAGDTCTQFALGSGNAHTHTLSLDLNYINVIRATKD